MIVSCPHCNEQIEILSINCGIFRHAIFKDNQKQIDPHASKELCDSVVKGNLVYGCAKPFRIIDGRVEKCEYI